MKEILYRNGVVRSGEVYNNGEWYQVYRNHERDTMEEAANETFNELFGFPATVVCIIEREHSKNSFHPKGFAEDFRTWTTPTSGKQMSAKQKQAIKEKMDQKLGPDYDIVIEKTHLHGEYHPK